MMFNYKNNFVWLYFIQESEYCCSLIFSVLYLKQTKDSFFLDLYNLSHTWINTKPSQTPEWLRWTWFRVWSSGKITVLHRGYFKLQLYHSTLEGEGRGGRECSRQLCTTETSVKHTHHKVKRDRGTGQENNNLGTYYNWSCSIYET